MNLFTDNYIMESTVENYSDTLPQLVPYMTFDEYCQITGNPNNYTPIEYIYQYEFANTDYNFENEAYEESEVDILEELNLLYENNELKQLIEMGWDVNIAPNAESMVEARDIQLNWLLNNHVCNEVSAFDDSPIFLNEITEKEAAKNENLAPIFIVQQFEPSPAGVLIKGYGKVTGKGWKYSHGGLALNSSLQRVYTFLLKGMSAESIVKFAARDNDIRVQALFITPKARNIIKKELDFYLQNQDKTKYSFAGIGKLVFNMGKQKKFSTQMFCSEFVDALLKGAHIDVSGKASENVAPEDLGMYTDNINIYPVFEGKAKDYDQAKVDEKIEKLKKTVKYEQLNAVKTKSDRTAIKDERERTEAEKKEEFDNSKKGKVINAVKKAGSAVAGAPKKGVKALMNKYSEYQKSAEYDEPDAETLRKQLATESAEEVLEEITDLQRRHYTRGSACYNFRDKDAKLYDKADKKDEKVHEKLYHKGEKQNPYGVSKVCYDLLDRPSEDIYMKDEQGNQKIGGGKIDPDFDKKVSYDKNRAKAVDQIIGTAEKEAYKEDEKRNK